MIFLLILVFVYGVIGALAAVYVYTNLRQSGISMVKALGLSLAALFGWPYLLFKFATNNK